MTHLAHHFSDSTVSKRESGIVLGTVVSEASQVAVVNISGIETTCRVVAGLNVDLNDVVIVSRYGSSRWVVAITALSSGSGGEEEQPKSVGDVAPNPKQETRTGTLVVKPVATSTYRNGKWRNDGNPVNAFDTFQGRYSKSSFGRQTGCAFYGSRPRNIAGATVTKVTVRVKRLRAGVFASRAPNLRLVNQSTRPSGAPTLEGSVFKGPDLRVGESRTYQLPDSWGQALVDGDSGGIAMHINSDGPYIAFAGKNSLSSAWTLRIDWKRDA